MARFAVDCCWFIRCQSRNALSRHKNLNIKRELKNAQNLGTSMLYSPTKNFIFVHIPKTAGTSIRSILQPYAESYKSSQWRRFLSHLPVPEDPKKARFAVHDKARWARLKMPRSIFENSLKFAVVRNPYDYAVSYYEFQRSNPALKRYKTANGEDFLDFLNRMERKNRILGITQSSWVTDANKNLIVDRILRFENLRKELPLLLAELGIDAPKMPHLNASPRKDLKAYYDTENLKKAKSLFEMDFDLFGYDKAI